VPPRRLRLRRLLDEPELALDRDEADEDPFRARPDPALLTKLLDLITQPGDFLRQRRRPAVVNAALSVGTPGRAPPWLKRGLETVSTVIFCPLAAHHSS
jgi:hypothetical protein